MMAVQFGKPLRADPMVRGLMVVDTSIMPLVPSAPTNLRTIMIAELVARRCLVAGSV